MTPIRFIVGVMTHNPLSFCRADLLEETLDSVEKAFDDSYAALLLYDNGSYPGQVSHRDGWHFQRQGGGPHDPGYGRAAMMARMRLMRDHNFRTVYIWSDDDMRWDPQAGKELELFWREAWGTATVLSAYLEPDFDHSRPIGIASYGGVKALCRESLPGAALTFPESLEMAPACGPHPNDELGWGYDSAMSTRLRSVGVTLAAIDLCQHIGDGASTHNNQTTRGRPPIDKTYWGLD